MSAIFVSVHGFGNLNREIVFLAKEGNKSKVIADIMQRYANVINENIKGGKTLREKKLWYRKLVDKYQNSYNPDVKESAFLRKMVNAFLQEFQHSRSYDLIDYDSKYDYKDDIDIDIMVSSLKIMDRSEGYKEITENDEIKDVKERVNKKLEKLKKVDPKGWCLINSVDNTYIVGNEFKEDKGFNCYLTSDKKFMVRIDYYAITMIEENKLYGMIQKAVSMIVDKSRGHYIKEKAKQLYKETFGMTWK